MFTKAFPGILSFFLAFNLMVHDAVSSQVATSKVNAEQKAQILQIINLFRAGQNQKPLRLIQQSENISLTKTSAGISTAGSISGRLYSEDREFGSMGYVTAWSSLPDDDSGVAMAVVHPDGFYRLTNLNSGEFYVLAISEEFVPMFYNNAFNFNDATQVILNEGDAVEGIDFNMQRTIPGTGSISGSVSGEVTDNTIAGVSITVWSPDNPFYYGAAKTDANGAYIVTGLKTGDYYASAFKEGYLTEFYENAETMSDATVIQVFEPDETTGISFTLSEGGRISGRVTDEDGDGIMNAYVEAAPSFWVIEPDPTFLDSVWIDTWGFAQTDVDGFYTITGLRSGDYYVSVRAGDAIGRYFEYYDDVHSIDEATPVPVILEQETTDINFEIPLNNFKGEIKGIVTDQAGNPIKNAYINVVTADDSSFALWLPLPNGITNYNGEYHIESIPDGNYYVVAYFSDRWQRIERWWPNAQNKDGAEIVTFEKDNRQKRLDFELPITSSSGVISGFVNNMDGQPLPFAFVQITTAPDVLADVIEQIWAYANTDSNGFYEVTGLPEGEYTASTQYWQDENFGQQWYDHQDSYENADRIYLAQDDTLNIINFDLDIKPYYGAISGVVTNEETGELISRAYIEITPIDFQLYFRPFYNWPYYAVTEDNGEYNLDWLPSGEYIVAVYTNGAFEYYEDAFSPENATKVVVSGGETTTVDFGITKKNDGPGLIAGQVYDEFNDGLLEIAIVKATPVQSELTDPNPKAVYTAVIDYGGNYEITGLPQGEFIVYAYSPNYIGEYYDSVYDPTEANIIVIDSAQTRFSGVDFSLHPAYFFAIDFRNAEGAPAVNASILGKIIDENDNSISDAFVYLMNEDERPVAFARSNAHGHYELANIEQGIYKVKATHVGYRSAFNGAAASLNAAAPLEITNGAYELNLKLQAGTITTVDDNETVLPKTVQLHGNYPNPFNPATQISFGLPKETEVRLSVYNLLGQKVKDLFSGKLNAGNNSINWYGQNNYGQSVPSGIYFYVLQTNENHLLVKKMTLLK